jgi:UPF0755 protein
MKQFILIIGLLFLAAGASLAWFMPRAWFRTATEPYAQARITVGENWDAARTAQELKKIGAIDSEFGYRIYAYIDKAANEPRAGEYDVFLVSNYRNLARQLFRGPERDEVEIRILEGLSLKQQGDILEKYGVKREEFEQWAGDGHPFPRELRELFPFLSILPPDASLEGYLYPDTYRVWKDQLPMGLIEKQLSRFQKLTQGMIEAASNQGRNFHDVVTLASIVEKEAARGDDRKIVAGIYLNRLKKGMRLQSDATVNYITGAGRARPTLKDLEADSPYNTYMHDGLPPGPIASPGIESIEAALNPTQTDYLFYLHDEQGKSYYARTLEEHKQNRYKAYGE